MIAVLDPGLIVIGGGIGGNADLLLEPTKRLLADLLALSPPPIEMSMLGRDAVVLGGLAAGLDRARDDRAGPDPGLTRAATARTAPLTGRSDAH